jgi:hypothetical protein
MPENANTSLSDNLQENGPDLKKSDSEKSDKASESSFMAYIKKELPLWIFISSVFYLIWGSYYINYYNILSLPFFTLDFPFTFILNAVYVFFYHIYNLILLVFILSLTYFILDRIYDSYKGSYSKDPKKKKYPLWDWFKNPYLWLYIFIVVALLYLSSNSLPFPLNILIFLSLIYAILIFVTEDLWGRKYFDEKKFRIWDLTVLWLFIISFSIIFLLITPASYLGAFAAENLINGESDHFEIEFSIKDENISIPNGASILILHKNGYYYLVERRNKTLIPKSNLASPTKLYAIPESSVKNVSIRYYDENEWSYDWYREFLNSSFDWIKEIINNLYNKIGNSTNELYSRLYYFYNTNISKKFSHVPTNESRISQSVNQSRYELKKEEPS